MPDTKECAHQGCHCQVEAGQTYCCDGCEKAEQAGTSGGCNCNHGNCGS